MFPVNEFGFPGLIGKINPPFFDIGKGFCPKTKNGERKKKRNGQILVNGFKFNLKG